MPVAACGAYCLLSLRLKSSTKYWPCMLSDCANDFLSSSAPFELRLSLVLLVLELLFNRNELLRELDLLKERLDDRLECHEAEALADWASQKDAKVLFSDSFNGFRQKRTRNRDICTMMGPVFVENQVRFVMIGLSSEIHSHFPVMAKEICA